MQDLYSLSILDEDKYWETKTKAFYYVCMSKKSRSQKILEFLIYILFIDKKW